MKLDAAQNAVVRLVQRRWPNATGDEIGAIVMRAAKARDLSVTRAEYLRALAAHHDMIARALRLAARAADGEQLDVLAEERIDGEVSP